MHAAVQCCPFFQQVSQIYKLCEEKQIKSTVPQNEGISFSNILIHSKVPAIFYENPN